MFKQKLESLIEIFRPAWDLNPGDRSASLTTTEGNLIMIVFYLPEYTVLYRVRSRLLVLRKSDSIFMGTRSSQANCT